MPPWPRHHLEPLAGLAYARELELKAASLAAYLRLARLPLEPQAVRPSPVPRGYRSTSKRRVLLRGGRIVLAANRDDPAHGGFTPSALEPEAHARLFRHLAAALDEPALGRTASRLSWVILRASVEGNAVIFNAARSDDRIVGGLTRVAREAAAAGLPVCGGWLFVDPSRSDYYLESGTTGTVELQRLFGPDRLRARFGGTDYLFRPGVFSQVNASVVPPILAEARRMLGRGGRLWDLYCGYGLFALALSGGFASVVGVETSTDAVACARANAERLRLRPEAAEFCEARITGPALQELFAGHSAAAEEAFVLDPPYRGAPAPVLIAAARRRPARVLHVFCNTSRIPVDAAIWRKAGYRISEIVPFDMFPGTPELETLALLEPAVAAGAAAAAR